MTPAAKKSEPILPPLADAVQLAPSPGSVTWHHASDARIMAASAYALMLQVAHPTVGAGVSEYSNFRAEPWQRLLRTLDFTTVMVYGGPEAAHSMGSRVREMHKHLKGTKPDGERYHALEPDAYAWVHATLADAIVKGCANFARPIPEERLEDFWLEWKRVGRLLGVRDRDLPGTWAEFGPYFDETVNETLERTASVDDVLATLAAPVHPPLRGVGPLWPVLRMPAVRAMRTVTPGLMSDRLRARLGLPWTSAQEREFRAIAAVSRRSGRLMPQSLRQFGPAYLRWRHKAIARGDVANLSRAPGAVGDMVNAAAAA